MYSRCCQRLRGSIGCHAAWSGEASHWRQQRHCRTHRQRVGIGVVLADVLPGDKVSKVRELQAPGKKVGMVGDGVNDAPALVQADLSFAIGAGTDVSMESAHVVLMKNGPFDVVGAIELSRAKLRKVHQNLWCAVGYNVIAFPLAAGVLYRSLLAPSIAAIAMSGSSALVAINALMLKRTNLTGIRRQNTTAAPMPSVQSTRSVTIQ